MYPQLSRIRLWYRTAFTGYGKARLIFKCIIAYLMNLTLSALLSMIENRDDHITQILFNPLDHGLLFTNSSKSALVATPSTNLRDKSVTTANPCLSLFSPCAPTSLSKKASNSSNGVSIVIT